MSDLFRIRLAYVVGGCAVAWFLARAVQALPVLEFGDESEHVVVALMIAAGDRLYANIFANHGPLAYALSHFWLLLTGSKDLSSYRLISLALYALCAGAIFASPVLTQARARLYAVTLFLVPLGVVYAATTLHMVMYQSMAGALLIIELALFSVPAVLGVTPSRWASVAAGFAAACAVFAALSFAVAAALLAAAGIAMAPDETGARRRAIGGFVAGALAAVLVFGLWITLFSDWAGYFVYHYWFNLTVYAGLIRYTPLAPFISLINFDFGPETAIACFAIAAYYATLAMLIALAWRGAGAPASWRRGLGVAALAVGLAHFNPRGMMGFHASTFIAGVLGFAALITAKLLAADPGTVRLSRAGTIGVRIVIGMFAGGLVLVHQFGLSSPHQIAVNDLSRHTLAPKPSEERVYRLIRELVPADERILAVVFVPAIYLFADRRPVSGNFFYLPMQAIYARQPFWGYYIDICKDVTERRPKVIFWEDRLGAGKWGFAEYAPCVYREIVDNYVPLPWAPAFHVRREIAAARPEIMRD